MVKNYENSQDLALGLSFALATDQFKDSGLAPMNSINWGFTKSVNPIENILAMQEQALGAKRLPINPFTLWRVSSLGINKPPMPERLKLKLSENPFQAKAANCLAPQPSFSAMGLTYQRYDCKPS